MGNYSHPDMPEKGFWMLFMKNVRMKPVRFCEVMRMLCVNFKMSLFNLITPGCAIKNLQLPLEIGF